MNLKWVSVKDGKRIWLENTKLILTSDHITSNRKDILYHLLDESLLASGFTKSREHEYSLGGGRLKILITLMSELSLCTLSINCRQKDDQDSLEMVLPFDYNHNGIDTRSIPSNSRDFNLTNLWEHIREVWDRSS